MTSVTLRATGAASWKGTVATAADLPTNDPDGSVRVTLDTNVLYISDGSTYVPVGGGVGIPSGGTTGQVLEKIDATNFNVQWSTPTGGVPTGTPNSFAVYNGSGNLSDYTSMSVNTGNGVDLNQSVAPAATGAYIKHNNLFLQLNPSIDSDENWYAQWSEPRINDTGFQMGNPATGNGGLNGFGMAMTADFDFGYMRNFDFSIQVGNGTDPVSSHTVAAINQYINVGNNSEVQFMYGFPLSFSGQAGSEIENIIAFPVNLNVAECTNSISIWQLGGNAAFTGLATYFQGLSINPTITGVVNASAIDINMSNVAASGSKYAINVQNGDCYFGGNVQIAGTFNFTGDLSVGSLQSFKALSVVDSPANPTTNNGIVSQINGTGVVANCDTIGLSTPSLINLDATFVGTSGGFGLGLCSLALPNLINMQAGCSLDNITSAAYVNLFDAANTGGTIGRVIGCRATNIPSGGTQTITRAYNFFADYFAGDVATDSWGFYDSGAQHNWLSGGLKIGGTSGVSDTTTNTSIGLELEAKAIRLATMTTTQRNALTAVAGMLIFNTTTAAMEVYDGSAWV